MKRIQCPITRGNGRTHYVPAYVAAPGLAVHRWSYTRNGDTTVSTNWWSISHISSGRSATPNGISLQTRREAARLARCLAEEVDWTADEETLDAKIRFRTHIAPAVERFKAGHDPAEESTT